MQRTALRAAAWSFYILGAGETPAPQPEGTTARIVVQASSLQSVMPTIPDPERFTRALIDYFDDDSQPGYSPTAALDGNARISAHFPEHAVELRGQIDQMFESAFNLPDLASLALDDAMAAIRRFIASEYPFLPSVLQEKVVNCCGYSLWK